MQVNGEQISDNELERMIDEIRPYADAMSDPPTEFEMITALAMKFFLYKKCDIVVLEVGMGGELDSTNVIETPELAVITLIGYDHVRELGPALTDIASAKAGIIKNGGDVLIYSGEPEVESVFECVCEERSAILHRTDFKRIKNTELSLDGIKFEMEPYGIVSTPLLGVYQPKNAALAITALELLRGKGYKITDSDIITGIAAVKWQGRFELLGHEPVFILDGAHNPQGAESAAESLRQHFGGRKIIYIIGVMADKDVKTMLSHAAPLAEAFIAVRPDHPRAMDAQTLAEMLAEFGPPVTAYGTIAEGVAEAIKTAGRNGIICALGSLFFSAEIRAAHDTAHDTAQDTALYRAL